MPLELLHHLYKNLVSEISSVIRTVKNLRKYLVLEISSVIRTVTDQHKYLVSETAMPLELLHNLYKHLVSSVNSTTSTAVKRSQWRHVRNQTAAERSLFWVTLAGTSTTTMCLSRQKHICRERRLVMSLSRQDLDKLFFAVKVVPVLASQKLLQHNYLSRKTSCHVLVATRLGQTFFATKVVPFCASQKLRSNPFVKLGHTCTTSYRRVAYYGVR